MSDNTQSMQNVYDIFDATLNTFNFPVFICDSKATIVFANKLAYKTIDNNHYATTSGNRVNFNNPKVEAMFLNAFQDADNDSGIKFPLVDTTNQKYTIVIKPIEFSSVSDDRLFRVSILKRSLIGMPSRDHIQNTYGLSETESEIVLLLCEGYTVSKIADIRKNRPSTIRQHIKSCFQKTFSNSQVELVNCIRSLGSIS